MNWQEALTYLANGHAMWSVEFAKDIAGAYAAAIRQHIESLKEEHATL